MLQYKKRDMIMNAMNTLASCGRALTTWYTSYFTPWILTAILLSMHDMIPREWTHSVRLLAANGMVGGLYITYIWPQEIHVRCFHVIVRGRVLQVMDVLSHSLPFVLYIRAHPSTSCTSRTVTPFMCVKLAYMYVNPNARELYDLEMLDGILIELITWFIGLFLL